MSAISEKVFKELASRIDASVLPVNPNKVVFVSDWRCSVEISNGTIMWHHILSDSNLNPVYEYCISLSDPDALNKVISGVKTQLGLDT